MKLVYLGSPEAAVEPLRALVSAGHDVRLVVSQPDRRRGRGSTLVPSPVKSAALELGVPVTDDANQVVEAVQTGAELGVVVAYGALIRKPLLAAMPFVNLHFSLLPRWRGAAPVERAILAGDHETGVCLMGLEAGLDTGPVFDRVVTAIADNDDLASLRARLVGLGTELLIRRLSGGFATLGTAHPQLGESTYAAKIDPSELAIDWSSGAVELDRLIRLGSAWTTFRSRRMKILRARVGADPTSKPPGTIDGMYVHTGVGLVELVLVQPEGKAPMGARAWRNGAQPGSDELLGR